MEKKTLAKKTKSLTALLLSALMLTAMLVLSPTTAFAADSNHSSGPMAVISQSTTGAYAVGSYMVNTETDPIRLRQSPSESATILIRIPKGTILTLTKFDGAWGYTTYAGYSGWVSMDYMLYVSPSSTDSSGYQVGTYRVHTESTPLMLRSTPSSSASILARIPQESLIVITRFDGAWGYTTYGGYSGWVSMDYVVFVSPSSTDSSGYQVGTYRVHTESTPLMLRSTPSSSASILARIPQESLIVITRFDGAWGYTTYGGYSGWVSMDYVVFVSSSTSGVSSDTTGSDTSTYKVGTYTVTTNSGSLKLHTEPNTTSTTLIGVPKGTQIVVTKFENGFGYTTYQGYSGWVSMAYLTFVSSSTSQPSTDTSTYPNDTTYQAGTYKVTTESTALMLRSSPSSSASILARIPKGDLIVITRFDGAWGYTTYAGYSGWVSMDYVLFVSSSTSDVSSDTTESDTSGYQVGTYTVTTNSGSLRLRAEPNTSSATLIGIPKGTQVIITRFQNNFGYTSYGGYSGWVSMEYMTFVSNSTSEPSTEAPSDYKAGTHRVSITSGTLRLRAEPNMNSATIGAIPKDTLLVLTKFENGFGYTNYMGTNGWVSMSYMTFVSSSTSEPSTDNQSEQKLGVYTVTTQGGNLILRASTTTTSAQLALIPNGTELVISEISNGWGKTTYNGQSGWVSMSWVTFKSQSSDIEQTGYSIGYYKVTLSSGELIAKDAPSDSAKQVTLIPNGTVLFIESIDGTFGRTFYDGIYCFVSLSYLTPTNEELSMILFKAKIFDAEMINVYASVDINSKVNGTIPKGETLNITSVSGDWGYAVYNNISGFVRLDQLYTEESMEVSSNRAYAVHTYDSTGTVFMHEKTSIFSKSITKIPNGKLLIVEETNGLWSRIRYNRETGYVLNLFLSESNSDIADYINRLLSNAEVSVDDTDCEEFIDEITNQLNSPNDDNDNVIGGEELPNDEIEGGEGEIVGDPSSDKDIKYGDITGDGEINLRDVVELQKAIAKLRTLSESENLKADVDADTKLTMLDVTTIQKFIAKLITSFPAQS